MAIIEAWKWWDPFLRCVPRREKISALGQTRQAIAASFANYAIRILVEHELPLLQGKCDRDIKILYITHQGVLPYLVFRWRKVSQTRLDNKAGFSHLKAAHVENDRECWWNKKQPGIICVHGMKQQPSINANSNSQKLNFSNFIFNSLPARAPTSNEMKASNS